MLGGNAVPRKNFHLAGIEPNVESKELFEKLAVQAESGELVGAIVISMCRRTREGKQYFLSLSGWASNNPTFAAGAMSSCQVLVQELALQDAGLI